MFPFGLFKDTSQAVSFQSSFIPHLVAKELFVQAASSLRYPILARGTKMPPMVHWRNPHRMIHLVQHGQAWPLVRKGRNILSAAPPQP